MITVACSGGDKFIGEWEEVDKHDVVKVLKENSQYVWQDDEGKSKATLKDGKLLVEAHPGTATVTYDKSKDRLIAAYMGMRYEFKRTK